MEPLRREELLALGVAEVGEDVAVDPFVRILNPSRLRIGSHVRIDAFAVLSPGEGGIRVGDRVHIAAHAFLAGAAAIELDDFAGLSGRVSIYSSSDDYSGAALTNPTVPDELRAVVTAPVRIGRHAIVGAGSVVLPGVEVGDGCAIGALSLVRRSTPPFTTWAGAPAQALGVRSKRLLELEARVGTPPAS